MAEAFKTYARDTPFVARTLHAKLGKLREDHAAQLAEPNIVKDWPDYQHRIGVVEGIDIAMGLCADAVKEESR